MKDKKCLILDFDGVIADSVIECLISSYNAFQKYQGNKKRIYNISYVPENITIQFISMRPLIRFGQDFVYIHKIINDGIQISTQEGFDKFLNEYKNLNDEFYKLYYQERTHFFEKQHDEWLDANPLYPGMTDFLSKRDMENTYIVTTKKAFFAYEILKGNKIKFNEENIFQARGDETKDKIVDQILSSNGHDPKQSRFIDDHIDMVRLVGRTGIKTTLAKWGYNGPVEHQKATENGIPVWSLEELFQLAQ